MFFYLILTGISTLITFWLPESPKFLVSKREYQEARIAYNKIAFINGKKCLSNNDSFIEETYKNSKFKSPIRKKGLKDYIDDDEEKPLFQKSKPKNDKGEKNEYNFSNLIEDKIHFKNLTLMNITWAASAFTYYMTGFYVKYIPGDIYTNVIVQ